MGSNNRQRKSSSSFFSLFKFFKTNKKPRGGHHEASDDVMKGGRIWPSDEDKGRWGVADPVIDIRAKAYIDQCKKKVQASECCQLDLPAGKAQ